VTAVGGSTPKKARKTESQTAKNKETIRTISKGPLYRCWPVQHKRPHPWDTHYQFSIKTLLSKLARLLITRITELRAGAQKQHKKYYVL